MILYILIFIFLYFYGRAGLVAQIGQKRKVYRILVGKLDGRIPLGRPRCRWVDNIKMNLREIR
jgi:hypothetical protein